VKDCVETLLVLHEDSREGQAKTWYTVLKKTEVWALSRKLAIY